MEQLNSYDEKVCELVKMKYEYMDKIKKLEEEIEKIKYEKYKECKRINNGEHIWISEREQGPYGETFHYCECCKYER